MSSSSSNEVDDCSDACDDSEYVAPFLLATGSALFLGYLLGRMTYSRDLRAAVLRVQESPEPIEVSIRTL
jgi:hypothetical protein